MDESSGDDDTRSKVFCYKEDPVWHQPVSTASCQDGEHGTCVLLVLLDPFVFVWYGTDQR